MKNYLRFEILRNSREKEVWIHFWNATFHSVEFRLTKNFENGPNNCPPKVEDYANTGKRNSFSLRPFWASKDRRLSFLLQLLDNLLKFPSVRIVSTLTVSVHLRLGNESGRKCGRKRALSWKPVRSSPHRFTKVGEGWQTFDPCWIPIVSGITVEHGGPWWTGQLSAPSKRATCVGGSFSGTSAPYRRACTHLRTVRIRIFWFLPRRFLPR